MNNNHRVSWKGTLALVPVIAVALFGKLSAIGATDDGAVERLSAEEIRSVGRLASAISRGAKSPDEATASLRSDVRQLSIREAAALGLRLLEEQGVDPRPWLALPHAREREATAKLKQLQQRLGYQESGVRYLETTVWGPQRLRKLCGDATLTEVIGVGLWSFYDGAIPAPTSISDDDVDVLVGLPGLQWVTANYSQLTDRGVVRLASLSHLREIRIANADVSDVSLEALGEHAGLRVIDVSGAKRVTDAGVEKLGRCVGLEELHLSRTGVTSACLPVISRLRKLRDLSLSGTPVRRGLSQLCALKDLRNLELAGLGTSESPVPADELEFISDLRQLVTVAFDDTATKRLTLQDLPNLGRVTLGHATLEDVTLVNLPKVGSLEVKTEPHKPSLTLGRLEIRNLPSLRWLAVGGLKRRAADGLAAGLSTMPNIDALYLEPEMTESLADAIGGLPHLKTLGMPQAAVTDAQLAAIARCRHLSYLVVGGKSLTSTGLRALSRSASLSRLQLEDLVLDEADFLEALKSVETLRLDRCRIGRLHIDDSVAISSLDIRQGTIRELTAEGSQGFRRLSMGTSHVPRLTVDSCPAFDHLFCGGDVTLDQTRLWNLPALESMTLQEGTAPGTLSLKRLPSLRKVEFWAAKLQKQHVEALEGLPALKHLDISGTSLGDDTAEVVARLRTLERLHASGFFSKGGLKKIAHLRSLRTLSLYHGEESDWTRDEVRRLFAHVPDVSIF